MADALRTVPLPVEQLSGVPDSPGELHPLPFIYFGKCEMETEAMKLLMASVQKGTWVGVPWKDFALTGQPGWWYAILRRFPMSWGWARFPSTKSIESDSGVRILSGSLFSMVEVSRIEGFPASIVDGVDLLHKGGWIRIENGEKEDVIFPTTTLMEKTFQAKTSNEEGSL